MKIELIYDGEGNLMVVKSDGSAEYFYCESSIPDELEKLLWYIPKYKEV